MGKLKQLVVDLDSGQVEFAMEHYGLFLQKAMQDKTMPNTWEDAINAIHWAAYISGVDLGRIQIEYIINQQTESLYESD
jgi:hypothetical protein